MNTYQLTPFEHIVVLGADCLAAVLALFIGVPVVLGLGFVYKHSRTFRGLFNARA